MNENRTYDLSELIGKYLSKEISSAEMEALNKLLHESKENRDYFYALKNVLEVSSPKFDPELISSEKALRKVTSKIDRTALGRKVFLYVRQVAAILLLPMIALNLYYYIELNYTDSVGSQEIYTPLRTRTEIILPDSSRVFLNSGSKLKYPLRFASSQREVELVGEGYFEVKADASYPFIVRTQGASVTATGTAFNVEAYAEDTLMAVTMVHGKVSMMLNRKKVDSPLQLRPGSRVEYNLKNGKTIQTQEDAYKYCSWKDGKLIFRNDPLVYVLKDISHMFNVSIELRDKEISSIPFRATFVDESLEDILRLLKLSIPIEVEVIERQVLVDGSFTKPRVVITKRAK